MRIWYLVALWASGCAAVEYLGAVSMETHRHHVEQSQELFHDAVGNQAKLGSVVVDLANEVVIDGRAADDQQKLIRGAESRARARDAVQTSDELARTKFDLPPENTLDFSGILSTVLTLLGGTTPILGGAAFMLSKKLGRVKQKAKQFASSPSTHDISDDRDLA